MMQLDLDRVLRLMWMVVLSIWAAGSYSSTEPIESKPDRRSQIAVWVVSVAWVLLLLRRMSGPLDLQLVPRIWSVRVIGSSLTVIGLLFALWSRYYLGRNWDPFITLKQNHRLVRTGPYAIVRHPICSGFMLAAIGSALALGRWRSSLAALMIVVAWVYKSGAEEGLLIKHFGVQYEEYRRQVKRLVPYVW